MNYFASLLPFTMSFFNASIDHHLFSRKGSCSSFFPWIIYASFFSKFKTKSISLEGYNGSYELQNFTWNLDSSIILNDRICFVWMWLSKSNLYFVVRKPNSLVKFIFKLERWVEKDFLLFCKMLVIFSWDKISLKNMSV